MMPTSILPVIANALNQFLQLDPEMQQRLQQFDQRVVRATIATFDWTFYIKISNQQLKLLSHIDEPIDAAFKAGIITLTKAAFAEKSMIYPELELQGDVAMIQAIISIFKEVEIDWEQCLSEYTGDIIAHGMSQVFRGVQSFHTNLFSTCKLNIKEYLQEEINLLLSSYELEDFCKSVDILRDDIERAIARTQLIEAHVKEN